MDVSVAKRMLLTGVIRNSVLWLLSKVLALIWLEFPFEICLLFRVLIFGGLFYQQIRSMVPATDDVSCQSTFILGYRTDFVRSLAANGTLSKPLIALKIELTRGVLVTGSLLLTRALAIPMLRLTTFHVLDVDLMQEFHADQIGHLAAHRKYWWQCCLLP